VLWLAVRIFVCACLVLFSHVTGQPADDGDGDWAPGMRRSAMAQLKEEEAQAKQTAKEASDEDADSAY